MVDDRENLDPEDRKEDSFEFDSAGEAVGYISMYRPVSLRCVPLGTNRVTTGQSTKKYEWSSIG